MTNPSIFADTMAEMTYPQLEEAVAQGAVALWALGVIEEHGPHLPLGTDVYLPCATLRLVRSQLQQQGIPAVIVPPFYWGVNSVTAAFAGSITVRPEVMMELVVDVLGSLRRDGLEAVFCLSGHGDSLHNQTLIKAIVKARTQTGVRALFVMDNHLRQRLDVDASERHIVEYQQERPRRKYPDIHAGYGETSMMWAHHPQLVRDDLLPQLAPTPLTWEEIGEWTQGWSNARRITPQGYLGDPASANADQGREMIAGQARLVTEAIVGTLQSGRF